MLIDDLGVERMAPYGADDPLTTPRLDALASESIRFHNAYASPLCSPSRAELLTGRWSHRYGLTHAVDQLTDGQPWPLRGQPFPINRYYFPVRPVPPPRYDALIFGSNGRDLTGVCHALAESRAERIAALGNPEDLGRLEDLGARFGLDLEISGPRNHVDLLELLEQEGAGSIRDVIGVDVGAKENR